MTGVCQLPSGYFFLLSSALHAAAVVLLALSGVELGEGLRAALLCLTCGLFGVLHAAVTHLQFLRVSRSFRLRSSRSAWLAEEGGKPTGDGVMDPSLSWWVWSDLRRVRSELERRLQPREGRPSAASPSVLGRISHLLNTNLNAILGAAQVWLFPEWFSRRALIGRVGTSW